jgi:hypothetical protein
MRPKFHDQRCTSEPFLSLPNCIVVDQSFRDKSSISGPLDMEARNVALPIHLNQACDGSALPR